MARYLWYLMVIFFAIAAVGACSALMTQGQQMVPGLSAMIGGLLIGVVCMIGYVGAGKFLPERQPQEIKRD